MGQQFIFTGSDSSREQVTFGEVERPHGDGLTFFVVRIVAEHLEGSCTIESLNGDHGADLGSEQLMASGASSMTPIRLSKLFVDLGSGPIWDGDRCWRSLAGELHVSFTADDLGHVDVTLQISPRPWQPTWSAACVLRYNLGDLIRLGVELGRWFDDLNGELE